MLYMTGCYVHIQIYMQLSFLFFSSLWSTFMIKKLIPLCNVHKPTCVWMGTSWMYIQIIVSGASSCLYLHVNECAVCVSYEHVWGCFETPSTLYFFFYCKTYNLCCLIYAPCDLVIVILHCFRMFLSLSQSLPWLFKLLFCFFSFVRVNHFLLFSSIQKGLYHNNVL